MDSDCQCQRAISKNFYALNTPLKSGICSKIDLKYLNEYLNFKLIFFLTELFNGVEFFLSDSLYRCAHACSSAEDTTVTTTAAAAQIATSGVNLASIATFQTGNSSMTLLQNGKVSFDKNEVINVKANLLSATLSRNRKIFTFDVEILEKRSSQNGVPKRGIILDALMARTFT